MMVKSVILAMTLNMANFGDDIVYEYGTEIADGDGSEYGDCEIFE